MSGRVLDIIDENKRIKELYDLGGQSQLDVQNFIDSIIQECITVLNDQADRYSAADNIEASLVISDMAALVKTNFEVVPEGD
jgi:hypothetical protein